MEISSGYLDKSAIQAELPEILEFLGRKSDRFELMHGAVSICDHDDVWKSHPAKLGEIPSIIENWIQDRIFEFGEWDLYLQDTDNKYRFLLCHETDIHFFSEDDKAIQEIKKVWESKGFKVYEI